MKQWNHYKINNTNHASGSWNRTSERTLRAWNQPRTCWNLGAWTTTHQLIFSWPGLEHGDKENVGSQKEGDQAGEVENVAGEEDKEAEEDENEEDICFICLQEDSDDVGREDTWLQCDRCNFWAHVFCAKNIANQVISDDMINDDKVQWICENCK